MGRYSSGARSAGAGSSTLPIGSLYNGAAVAGRITEIGVFNTSTTGVAIRLVRLSSTGTQGAGLAESKLTPRSGAAGCAAFDTHTGAPTIADDLGYRASLAGAVGAGIVWTFDDEGLQALVGTANGIGIIPVGTGQVLDWYVVWDE
jgi:hypothetical protein